MTLISTVVAAALGLVLGLMSAPAALANPADENGCHSHKSCSAGDGDTTPGNKSIPLVFTLADTVPANLMNDDRGDYIHKEGHVSALAGGAFWPFPISSTRAVRCRKRSADDEGFAANLYGYYLQRWLPK